MTHQEFFDLALVGGTLVVALIIYLSRALGMLERIVASLDTVKDELGSIQMSIPAADAPSTDDIEDLLERICGALGAPPDVRPMVRALTSLRDAIDKGVVSAVERATTDVVRAKLRLDQSIIPCAAQGELREVMIGMAQAWNARADPTDLRAKIELAITALLTASP